MTIICGASASAQTSYNIVKYPNSGHSILDPCTGEELVVINSNNTYLSVQDAPKQAAQLRSDLINEVDRRIYYTSSSKSKSTFPEASSFLQSYDLILWSQKHNLANTFKVTPEQVLTTHISWLINRHIDVISQLKNASDSKLQTDLQNESESVYKELKYLQNHPAVEGKLKNIISEYINNVDNNRGNADKPNPGIYFIRGKVAACCFSYNDAISDYLEGFECIRRDNTQNVADYVVFFDDVRKTLKKYSERIKDEPKVQDSVEKNDSALAAQASFHYGYSAFWEGQYGEAVILFTDAINRNNQAPIYWYYRALAWKRLGENDKANLDAYKGTRVEREVFGKRTHVVGFLLQRVQGEDRKWLEYKRIGYK